jgi:tRNA (cmo5U34)-methyltransferase
MGNAMPPFDDPSAAAAYAEGPPRLVPGFADMQRMALLLLREGAPPDAHILVVGAGGGLELKRFAEAQVRWRFTGVDPAAAMLQLAAAALGPLMDRIALLEGTIDAAPDGPFDGATALLTLHFVERQERLGTLRAIRRRLKPGAPFIAVHHSVPSDDREGWLARYAAFAASSGVAPEKAKAAAAAIAEKLPLLSPEEDEALLREAGFASVALFYAAFTFRGWIARA